MYIVDGVIDDTYFFSEIYFYNKDCPSNIICANIIIKSYLFIYNKNYRSKITNINVRITKKSRNEGYSLLILAKLIWGIYVNIDNLIGVLILV